MKKEISTLFSLLILLSTRSLGVLGQTPPAGGPWTLAFSDEFNGTSLNTSTWSVQYPRNGDMCCSNWNNGEAQWYLAKNITEQNGELVITARKENYTSPGTGTVFNYTSGLIQSKPSFNFTYGYFETRMWMPGGSGFWPAFWLWPQNEQWPPEIDAMEFYGDNLGKIYCTYHGPSGADGTSVSNPNWSAGWHIFAADWEPGEIKWYVDGVLVKTRTNPDVSKIPMYLIANLAITNGKGAPAPNSSTVFPSSLRIDYIRVWKKSTSPPPSAVNSSFCLSQQPPVIDGIAETTWTSVKTDTLKTTAIGTVSSPADLFCSWKARWDNANLYLLVTVKDDSKKNDSGTIPWDDDAVEIFIDGNNEKATTYDNNDRQYLFRWNDSTIYEYRNGAAQPVNPAGVLFRQSNSTDGYQLEIQIAWNAVGISVSQGKLVGFDIHAGDDDDGGTRDSKITWIATADVSSKDPSAFGTIKLDSSSCGGITTGAAPRETGNNLLIYPNPCTDLFKVYLPSGKGNVLLEVFNLLGQTVKKIILNDQETTVYTEGLRPGIYIYRVVTFDNTYPITGKISIR